MIRVRVSQNGRRIDDCLRKIARGDFLGELSVYGERGVLALEAATPKDTGTTARSWRYRITKTRYGYAIEWYNTNTITNGGPSVAVLIQYGHGTGDGGYVRGRDYINPAMRPVFDKIANEIWEKVRNG